MDAENNPDRALSWLTPGRFAALMAVLLLAAFPKVLLGLETFYYRDYGVLAYPVIFHEHECFWRGEFPLWNGLSNCGAPFLGQWGTMMLYPFSLIYLLFPLPWSLSFFCFGHLVLGAVGMYLLCRRWSRNETKGAVGPALAGTAYVFNGLMFSCLAWPNYTVALGWMPWVVLTAEKAWSQGGRSIVIGAVVATLQLLAGVPELAILTWVLIGSLWIYAICRNPCERRAVFFRLLGVISLAAALSAAQLLPFFDLLLHSQRDLSFMVSKWAMPASGWGNFLVPLFHCYESFQGPFFQYEQAFFSSYYLGAGVLALAAFGLWKDRDRRVWILAMLALLATLLALGNNGFLFPLVRQWVPLVGIARYPIKFLLLVGFIVPLLAGLAIAKLESASDTQRIMTSVRGRYSGVFWVPFGVAALLIASILVIARLRPFALDQWHVTLQNGIVRLIFLSLFAAAIFLFARSTNFRMKTALLIGILAIVFVDALTHTAQQNPSLPAHVLAGGLWQAQGKPAPVYGKARVFITPEAERHLLRDSITNASEAFLGMRLALWSHLNLLDQLAKVNGSSTLQIREQMQLQKLLYEQTNSLPAGLLDFLCVSHMSSEANLVEWSERTNFCPLITAGQKPEFVDDATSLRRLMDSSFDPRRTVFLPLESRGSVQISNSTRVEISYASVGTHRLSFRTSAAEPALCVLAQSFYHCWKPMIDGKPVPLLRANVAFQSILVPAGTHEIVFLYRDYAFCVGLGTSVAALAACLMIWRRTKPRALTDEHIPFEENAVEDRVGEPVAAAE